MRMLKMLILPLVVSRCWHLSIVYNYNSHTLNLFTFLLNMLGVFIFLFRMWVYIHMLPFPIHLAAERLGLQVSAHYEDIWLYVLIFRFLLWNCKCMVSCRHKTFGKDYQKLFYLKIPGFGHGWNYSNISTPAFVDGSVLQPGISRCFSAYHIGRQLVNIHCSAVYERSKLIIAYIVLYMFLCFSWL